MAETPSKFPHPAFAVEWEYGPDGRTVFTVGWLLEENPQEIVLALNHFKGGEPWGEQRIKKVDVISRTPLTFGGTVVAG
jgi:hypothetical protein